MNSLWLMLVLYYLSLPMLLMVHACQKWGVIQRGNSCTRNKRNGIDYVPTSSPVH